MDCREKEINMNACFKIFHLPSDSERNKYADEARSYFISYGIKELETKTMSIRNDDDVKKFLIECNEFKLDPNGYNLDCIQGWKYGEVGIWYSNYLAWSNFLKTDYDALILMEDDIVCQEGLIEDINNKLNEIPENWDFLSMFVPEDQRNSYKPSMSVTNNISRVYQDWSMLCYIVSKDGAKKLIKSCNNLVSLPLDWHIYRQREKFNSFSIKPDVKLMCDIAKIDSTFQNFHERKVLNGIL